MPKILLLEMLRTLLPRMPRILQPNFNFLTFYVSHLILRQYLSALLFLGLVVNTSFYLWRLFNTSLSHPSLLVSFCYVLILILRYVYVCPPWD